MIKSIIRPSIKSIRFCRFSSTIPEPVSVASNEEQPEHHQLQIDTTEKLQPQQQEQIVNQEEIPNEIPRVTPPKYNLNSLPRVPPTTNINHNTLYNDLLMNNYMPLLSPVKKNHSTPRKKKPSSVLDNLENFKKFKKQQFDKSKSNTSYYNTYLNKEKLPYNSIFCNTALNTQQHNLEIFNLPLNYLEKLKPFKLINKPGEEYYRDDLIVLSKIELEQINKDKKHKLNQKLAKEGKILDLEEFFGFK